MVTAGVDGNVKVWDTRKWSTPLNEYQFKKTPKSASFSQKGMLGLSWGNHVSVSDQQSRHGIASATGLTLHCRSTTIFNDQGKTLACLRRHT